MSAVPGVAEVSLGHCQGFIRFLLQSCGPADASLQMLKGKERERERRGPGWVSESAFRAAFVAVNGRAHGIHVNLFRWWLQPELPALITLPSASAALRGGLISRLFLSSNGSLCSGVQAMKTALNLPPASPQLFNTWVLFLLICLSNYPNFSAFPHQRFPKLFIVF